MVGLVTAGLPAITQNEVTKPGAGSANKKTEEVRSTNKSPLDAAVESNNGQSSAPVNPIASTDTFLTASQTESSSTTGSTAQASGTDNLAAFKNNSAGQSSRGSTVDISV